MKEKTCSTCRHVDEYFGDCCHPDFGGTQELESAAENCIRQNYKYWEEKKIIGDVPERSNGSHC